MSISKMSVERPAGAQRGRAEAGRARLLSREQERATGAGERPALTGIVTDHYGCWVGTGGKGTGGRMRKGLHSPLMKVRAIAIFSLLANNFAVNIIAQKFLEGAWWDATREHFFLSCPGCHGASHFTATVQAGVPVSTLNFLRRLCSGNTPPASPTRAHTHQS